MSTLINTLIDGVPLTSPCSLRFASCEPMTLMTAASVGMAAGGAAMNIIGQNNARQSAKGMENQRRIAQETAIEENRVRATRDYLRTTSLEQQQQSQEEQALVEKSGDIARVAQAAGATGTASAAERNVSGKTVAAIAADYDYQAAMESGRLKENQKIANLQHGENLTSHGIEYSNRVQAVKPYVMQPQAPVDYFGPIFGAISSSTSAASNFSMFKAGAPLGAAAKSTPTVKSNPYTYSDVS